MAGKNFMLKKVDVLFLCLLYLKFLGHPWDIPAKIPGYPAKSLVSLGLEGYREPFWPPPLHVEDPHPSRRYPDQKVWVWVPFFFPEYRGCGVDTETVSAFLFDFFAVASQLRPSLVVGFGGIRAVDAEFPYRVPSSMGGRLPNPCLPSPCLILRQKFQPPEAIR